jgi:Ribbon-helix-helix protein, copG family
MKKTATERLTFDAPKDMAQVIRYKAAQEGVSMADVIRAAIKKGLITA